MKEYQKEAVQTIYQAVVNRNGRFIGFVTGNTYNQRRKKANILELRLFGRAIKENHTPGKYIKKFEE